MKNYKTGAVYCDKCKVYIGNYMLGIDAGGNEKSYHSLIRIKYCKDCKAEVLRNQKRYIQKEYRKRETAKKKVLEEKNRQLQENNNLISAENKILKLKLFGTESPEQYEALIDLLKTLK